MTAQPDLPARILALLARGKHPDDQTHVSQGCSYCRAQTTIEWLAPASLQSVAELVEALANAPCWYTSADGTWRAYGQICDGDVECNKHQALRATEERLEGRVP